MVMIMTLLSIHSPFEIQQKLANAVRARRKKMKLSRQALAEHSTVPAPTIKRFETTGEISLRQFVMLWQCVDRLDTLAALANPPKPTPRTITEVLVS